MRRFAPIAVVIVLALGSPALSVPDYGYQWATIGDPGNRGVVIDEVPDRPVWVDRNLGAIGYEYRMATTEVTVGQWLEFVQAYQPYYTGSPSDPDFIGWGIGYVGGSYVLDTQNPDEPTTMSWEFAARYCNWLTNSKALTQEAFEDGAYDTSTFSRNDDNSINHQLQHHPGATFWIPTIDEWSKAAYWDPDKNGGQGGYWMYPGGRDAPLTPGEETNAGMLFGPSSVGSFPEINAPWGLLDTSGGESEWTERQAGASSMYIRGSARNSSVFSMQLDDRIDSQARGGVSSAGAGLRLASIVPAPSGAALLLLSGPLFFQRRRECNTFKRSSARSASLSLSR